MSGAQAPPDDEMRGRLVETARLAAVGRLMPSLAHQLSTPLASIALRSESVGKMCRESATKPPERLERYLQAILADVGHCNELLELMRGFARPQGEESELVDLNVVCRDVARLVHHEAMRRQIEIRLDLAVELPAPAGQDAALRGAVLWLVLNAIDASPNGSQVTVETRASTGEIAVAVVDEGEGVAEADRSRLFEPFFSTRPRGLGVSLMACRAVAEGHGGVVEVDVPRARGSRFRLRLPAAGPERAGDPRGDAPRA
jgi:signal transduction histidine kinase